MKKLKSIDFKALFLNHGEKFGLAAIADTDAATDALLRTVDVAQACCSMQQR